MEEIRIRLCQPEQVSIHLIGEEYFSTRSGLFFLTHARPYVGVDDVRFGYRLDCIVGDRTTPAGLLRTLLGPRQCIRLWLVASRGGDPYVCSQLSSSKHQRVGHIVSVSNKCNLQARYPTFQFPNREIVGHRLARMAVIGQTIDDRNTRE